MPQTVLRPEERQRLTNQIMTGLYEFSGGTPRDRRVLLEQAGLQKFLGGLDLNGLPRAVAGLIVGRLEEHGFLAERPNYHALGALLSYLLTLGDLGQEDARFVAELIVKYGLVRDPGYIGELRTTYQITAPAQPVALPTYQPPQPGVRAPIDATDFQPSIADEPGLERILNSADNFLDISLLAGAIYSAQAVGRIELPEGTAIGTGFLIGPDLLLTNQHVLQKKEQLTEAIIRFDYLNDLQGISATPGRIFRFQSNFYHASPATELDYALVRLTAAPLQEMTINAQADGLSPLDLIRQGKHRGYLVVTPRNIMRHERVNIIQHPDGNPLKVVMTQNYVVADMSEQRVHYVADTMNGSSGSAVFNRQWEVVALHHAGKPYPPGQVIEGAEKDWKGDYRVNEGIPMRAILADFQQRGLSRYLPAR